MERGWSTYICTKKPASESGDGVVLKALELKWHNRNNGGVHDKIRGDTLKGLRRVGES